jgi:Astacin (Peptidase family M12A)
VSDTRFVWRFFYFALILGAQVYFFFFSFAVNSSRMTLVPRDPALSLYNIGEQARMSDNDVIHINKAYGCQGTVSANAGGYTMVGFYFNPK